MSDILLVKPSPPKKFLPYPPLGPGYLASILRDHGISVSILNLEIDELTDDEFIDLVKNESPKIVGFSCMTCNFFSGIHFVSQVKKVNPDIVTVFGGAHPTFQAREILNTYRDIDIVVRGEGECTFLELVRRLQGKESISSVEGITYRGGDGIRETPNRPFIDDLDSLPFPARELMGLDKYPRPVQGCLITSRGCPWRCLYCSTSELHGHGFRACSPSYVVDEMRVLVDQYKCTNISVADDLFTFDKKRSIAICDEIMNRDMKITWGCSVRADTVDRELLSKMRESGCVALFIGIETVNENVMKLIKKGLKFEKVKKSIRIAKELGFHVKASFILGLPYQTPDEPDKILEFVKEAGLEPPGDMITINMLCPFPGTDIFDHPEKYGLRIVSDNFTLYNGLNCVIESESFPRSEVIDSYMKIMESNFQGLEWSNVEY
jgi:anaerobic magnesium-protoporphyrin IX monomethyl ester cyclase